MLVTSGNRHEINSRWKEPCYAAHTAKLHPVISELFYAASRYNYTAFSNLFSLSECGSLPLSREPAASSRN